MAKPVYSAVFRAVIMKWLCREQPEKVVEIGVFAAHLSMLIAPLPWVKKLWIIDSWDLNYKSKGSHDMRQIAQEVKNWAKTTSNVEVLHMTSERAAEELRNEEIDFIEIDGGHGYETVKSDIANFLPMLKPGCIMCGDNYEHPPLRRAVEELLPEHKIDPQGKGRVWWVRK
jgi:hypothetical protein